MRLISSCSLAAFVAAAILAPSEARADIFSFTDERGIVHFTNIPSTDKRYKLVYRDPAAPPPRRLARGSTPNLAAAQRYHPIVDSAARSHGVETSLVHAVISAESAYNPNAISRKGASGLMQLMPDTARRYGVRNVFDPIENVNGGVRYLRDLLAMFNGDMRLALAGYNAGENAVIRAGHKIPPYAETVNYVPKVIDFYHWFNARKG